MYTHPAVPGPVPPPSAPGDVFQLIAGGSTRSTSTGDDVYARAIFVGTKVITDYLGFKTM